MHVTTMLRPLLNSSSRAARALPAAALAGLFVKLVLIGHFVSPGTFPADRAPLSATLSILMLCAIPLIWLDGRDRLTGALLLNIAATILGLADLWHVRYYGDVTSIAELTSIRQIPAVSSSLAALMRPVDACAFLDVAALLVMAVLMPGQPADRGRSRRWLLATGVLILACGAGLPAVRLIQRDPDEVFESGWNRRDVVAAAGLAGYHAYDAAIHLLYPLRGRAGIREADIDEIEQTLVARDEGRFASRLAGIAQGLNLILLSAESLQAFMVDMTLDGQPLAPNFAKFARESLWFTDFYDQTHMGTTADGEFISLNSLLPLPTGAVATRFDANDFVALPGLLRASGYHTISACGEPGAFWNMWRVHPKQGFERSLFLRDFAPGDWIGVGLDDASFFAQMVPVLRAQPEPFFAYLLTSTNHHPYRLPSRLQQIHQTPWPGTMAGDYLQSVHYFDQTFGAFIDSLRAAGVLDRSVVVVYGDHQSWVNDGDLQRLWLSAGHQTPATPFELWRFRHGVPLMIRLPSGAEAGQRLTPGGHLDIAPTLASLIGVADRGMPWLGRDLTRPSRRTVVFRDGTVTDGRAFGLPGDGRAPQCFARGGERLGCELVTPLLTEGRALLHASDQIITGNLAARLRDRLSRRTPPAGRDQGGVSIIAHRGNSIRFPENTLPAIRSAFDLGADIVEVDIHRSRDGVAVVFHDDTLERTSNGRGSVETRTVSELKALDAGAWMDARFKGTRIPTLEEALRAARGRGRLYLDLNGDGLADPVRHAFVRAGVPEDDGLIATWNESQRAEFAKTMPRARLLKVGAAPLTWAPELFRQVQREGYWGIELGDVWPESFVGDARRHGIPVLAYTVNDEPTMRRLIEMGVSGIETDDPALLLKVATSLKAR